MMLRSTLILAVLALSPTVPSRADDLPQRATVVASGAMVRSGPGDKFYATGQLQAGQEVEIYRRKPGGWCAIRPPEGSFSWVRADHVRPTASPNVLEVTQPGSKTRVGSTLSRAYQVEYVSLKAGEQLQSLGGPVRLGTSHDAWYRVAPPSGEFRWIQARDLQQTGSSTADPPPAALADDWALPAAATPAPTPPNRPQASQVAAAGQRGDVTGSDQQAKAVAATFTGPVEPAERAKAGPPSSKTAEPSGGPTGASGEGLTLERLSEPRGQMNTERIPQPDPIPDPSIALTRHATGTNDPHSAANGPTELDEPAPPQPSAWKAVDAAPLPAPVAGPPTPETQQDAPPQPPHLAGEAPRSPQPLADADLRLAELELAVSRTVTQEVDRWDLDPLRQRAIDIAPYLTDARGQENLRQLMERIEEFAVLQRRHRDLSAAGDVGTSDAVSLASALSARPTSGGLAPPPVNLPPDPPNTFVARQAAIKRQALQARYAGQGWLVPVFSSRSDLPRFALTDAQGTILAFVSARPGLNLRRYQRREVGIVGRETARRDDSAPHLLADRVVVLDRLRR